MSVSFNVTKMEESAFIKTFGNTPKIILLDFLLDNDIFDYSKSEIAQHTGISRVTLDRYWDSLIKDQILIQSREIGRATMFKLNKQNLVVKKLIELDNFLTKQEIDNLEIETPSVQKIEEKELEVRT
tara:strand:+ start:1434 stop:1814 length:381 start_codon:yes stop_codon:yes gene_type:complete